MLKEAIVPYTWKWEYLKRRNHHRRVRQKNQYKFKYETQKGVEQVKRAIKNGKPEYAMKVLDDISDKLDNRNKDKRFADTHEDGWETFREYKSNPIARQTFFKRIKRQWLRSSRDPRQAANIMGFKKKQLIYLGLTFRLGLLLRGALLIPQWGSQHSNSGSSQGVTLNMVYIIFVPTRENRLGAVSYVYAFRLAERTAHTCQNLSTDTIYKRLLPVRRETGYSVKDEYCI